MQNVLFGMRDKDHSYIENFYHGKEDQVPTNEGIQKQAQEAIGDNKGEFTLIMTHNRDISYESYSSLGVKHVFVPKVVKDQIDQGA